MPVESNIFISSPEPTGAASQVPPLFVGPANGKSAFAELLSQLRLTGIPVAEDGLSLVTSALTRVRTGIYRALGVLKVQTIASYQLVQNPVNDTQLRRSVGASLEIAWMRAELMRTMRFASIDGGNSILQVANDEGLAREAASVDLGEEVERLMREVQESLAFLAGDQELGEELGFHCSTIEPDVAYLPGSSLFPGLR